MAQTTEPNSIKTQELNEVVIEGQKFDAVALKILKKNLHNQKNVTNFAVPLREKP